MTDDEPLSSEELAAFLNVPQSQIPKVEGIGVASADDSVSADLIADAARQDEQFQDGYEGFDADQEAGKGREGERGSSLGSSRLRLKAIQAGEADKLSDQPVGQSNRGFREERLEKALAGDNVVSLERMKQAVTEAGFTDQEEGEIAYTGAGFRFDGIAFVRDPNVGKINFDDPARAAASFDFITRLTDLFKLVEGVPFEAVLTLAQNCGLSIAERASALNDGGFTRAGSVYNRKSKT